MRHYPVFLNLKNKTVLLVGAGAVALKKLPALLECQARVRVVAKDVQPDITQLAQEGRIVLHQRGYESSDLKEAVLVIAATDDAKLQKRIAAEARAQGLWVNVVDVPSLCDFIAPALVSQGDIQIAISTGGAAPALAKFIRQKLEPVIGPEYGQLAEIAERFRPNILKLPKARRQSLWDCIVSPQFLEDIKAKGPARAEQKLKEWIHGNASF